MAVGGEGGQIPGGTALEDGQGGTSILLEVPGKLIVIGLAERCIAEGDQTPTVREIEAKIDGHAATVEIGSGRIEIGLITAQSVGENRCVNVTSHSSSQPEQIAGVTVTIEIIVSAGTLQGEGTIKGHRSGSEEDLERSARDS